MSRVTELTKPQVSDKYRFDMRNRHYEPETGRFMNRDLLPGRVVEPLSMNAYAFVENNPLQYEDPLGLEKSKGKTRINGVEVDNPLDILRPRVEVFDGADDSDWFYKPAKKNFIDKFTDWVTGEKSIKTQGDQVLEAQLITMQMQQQQIVMEFGFDFAYGLRSTATADRISEVLEMSSENTFGSKIRGAGKAKTLVPQNVTVVLEHIEMKGSPPQGYKGGRIFLIDGRDGGKVLPGNTTYREYDVNPNVKGQNRGSERLVIGEDGSAWYTDNHYQTFTRIK